MRHGALLNEGELDVVPGSRLDGRERGFEQRGPELLLPARGRLSFVVPVLVHCKGVRGGVLWRCS